MRIKDALSGLSALAHDGRLDLFRRLVRVGPEGIAAGDLARIAGLNVTTASAQVAVLARAGLVTGRRDGRSVIYTADYDAIRGLIGFLLEDCCQGRPEILVPLADQATRAACCAPPTGDVP